MSEPQLPSSLEAAIERGVADESIFTPANRTHQPQLPVIVTGGGDAILEVRIRVRLPQSAAVMDALSCRLGQSIDVLLINSVLQSSRMHLNQDAPSSSFAEVVFRSDSLVMGNPP